MTPGVYPMWQRLTRLKTLDTQTLHYSEWSKKLGSFDLLGFSKYYYVMEKSIECLCKFHFSILHWSTIGHIRNVTVLR